METRNFFLICIAPIQVRSKQTVTLTTFVPSRLVLSQPFPSIPSDSQQGQVKTTFSGYATSHTFSSVNVTRSACQRWKIAHELWDKANCEQRLLDHSFTVADQKECKVVLCAGIRWRVYCLSAICQPWVNYYYYYWKFRLIKRNHLNVSVRNPIHSWIISNAQIKREIFSPLFLLFALKQPMFSP